MQHGGCSRCTGGRQYGFLLVVKRPAWYYAKDQQPEGTKTLTSSAPRLQAAKQATVEDIRVVAESLAKSLEDDKAEDLLFIDLQGKSSLADFMIIASGRSGRHVAALVDHISTLRF